METAQKTPNRAAARLISSHSSIETPAALLCKQSFRKLYLDGASLA
jgi:hypothetical protein